MSSAEVCSHNCSERDPDAPNPRGRPQQGAVTVLQIYPVNTRVLVRWDNGTESNAKIEVINASSNGYTVSEHGGNRHNVRATQIQGGNTLKRSHIAMSLEGPHTKSSSDTDIPIPRGQRSMPTPSDHIPHPQVGDHVWCLVGGQRILCEVLAILTEPMPHSKSIGLYRLLDLHLKLTDELTATRAQIEFPTTPEPCD
ncbi:hypothetical protein OPQ81_001696 [Rhizoctonia solani]|nr:hypothetical protein OPQ81_001696 [Rhizoctonia solani]